MDNSQFIRMCTRASRISVILFLIPFAQLILTVAIPVNPSANPTEIYLRNISSIVSYFALGLFFSRFNLTHSFARQNNMKAFDHSILFLVIAGIIKAVISFIYFVRYITVGNLLGLTYFGEVLAWVAITFFALALKNKMNEGGLVNEESDGDDGDDDIDYENYDEDVENESYER